MPHATDVPGGAVPMWKKLTAVLVMIMVQISFGGYYIVSKAAYKVHTSPFIFILVRDTGGALVLSLAAYLKEGMQLPTRRDFILFALLGFSGTYMGQLLPSIALQYISANNAALLQPAAPVFALGLSAYLGMDTLDLRTQRGLAKLAGVLVAVVGAGVVVASATEGSQDSSAHTTKELIVGNVYMVLQVVTGSVFVCCQKELVTRYGPVTLTAWGYIMGMVMVVMAIVPTGVLTDEKAWEIPPAGLLAMAYAIVISSSACYAAMAWANKQTSPAVVMVTTTFDPVATAVMSWIFFGRVVSAADVLGGALVCVGLLLMVGAKMRDWKEEARAAERLAADGGGSSSMPQLPPAAGEGADVDAESGRAGAPGSRGAQASEADALLRRGGRSTRA